jgi:hypothetical protein
MATIIDNRDAFGLADFLSLGCCAADDGARTGHGQFGEGYNVLVHGVSPVKGRMALF